MKNTAVFVLVMVIIWVAICMWTSSEFYKSHDTIAFIPVADADTAETTPTTCYLLHEWNDWNVTKVDNLTGPGSKTRTCKVCNQEQTRAFMDTVNGICIPKMKVNTAFANASEYNLLNADFVYYRPEASHPTVMSNIAIDSLKANDFIYINTEWGLYLYVVDISEPATLNAEGDLIGNNTRRGLWQHDYERALHMYYLDGDTGWIVVARYLGIPK